MKKIIIVVFVVTMGITKIFGQECDSPVTRTVKKEKNNTFLVDVTIKVSLINDIDLKSFARLIEEIPEESTCKIINAASSDAQVKDNMLKLVWLQMPSGDFHVTYELKFEEKRKEVELNGTFNYLIKNRSKKALTVIDCV